MQHTHQAAAVRITGSGRFFLLFTTKAVFLCVLRVFVVNETESKSEEYSMSRYVTGGLAAILIFSSTICFGAVQATPQMIQDLMVKSGIKEQVEQLPKLVVYGIDQAIKQSSRPIPADVAAKLKQAAASSFRADAILDNVRQSIDKNLSRYDIEAILHWLTSPAGDKITRLEVAATSPGAYESKNSMKEELLKDTARVKRIRRLDAAVRVTEASVDLMMNIQIAVASSLAAAVAPGDLTLVDQFAKAVQSERNEMVSVMKEETVVSMLSTYRTLKDDEIESYIDFATSEIGSRYHDVVKEGFDRGIVNAYRELSKTLVQTLR